MYIRNWNIRFKRLRAVSLKSQIFTKVLNNHAPIKTKIIRANNHEFMIKALRKAIITISTLKNV